MDALPLVAVALGAASTALFLLVGRTVQRRPVSAEARSAHTAFVTWWYGIAGVSGAGVVLAFPGFPLDLRLFLAVSVVLLAVLCVALVGLLHYLVFLYTNRRSLLPFIAAGYGAFFLLLLAFILQSDPVALEDTRWGPEVVYANPIDSGPLYLAVVALLILPPVGAAAAYLSLYRLARDPVLKRRILLVSLSVILWFGSSLVGTLPGAQGADWWRLTSRAIGLAAAGVILYAYSGLRPAAPAAAQPAPGPEPDSPWEPPRPKASGVAPALAAA